MAESSYGDQAAAVGPSYYPSSHVSTPGGSYPRQSYLLSDRSPSSSPPGEAEGGPGPVPVIEFPDDEVLFIITFFVGLAS